MSARETRQEDVQWSGLFVEWKYVRRGEDCGAIVRGNGRGYPAARGGTCQTLSLEGDVAARHDRTGEHSNQDRHRQRAGVEIRTDRPSLPQKEEEAL